MILFQKHKKSLLIIGIVALSLAFLLICETIRWVISISSSMNDFREETTVYVPQGYPNDYFHNGAFQDPVSIYTYKLNSEEKKSISKEISSENSKWKLFTQEEVFKLYNSISFLDSQERKQVNFDTQSYYCCYSRDGRHMEQWITLSDAKYYSYSYLIFTYNPELALYNLIVI